MTVSGGSYETAERTLCKQCGLSHSVYVKLLLVLNDAALWTLLFSFLFKSQYSVTKPAKWIRLGHQEADRNSLTHHFFQDPACSLPHMAALSGKQGPANRMCGFIPGQERDRIREPLWGFFFQILWYIKTIFFCNGIYLLFHLFMHALLILLCALTGDGTHSVGV